MLLDYAVAQIASAHDVSTAVHMVSNQWEKSQSGSWKYREWVGHAAVREALAKRYTYEGTNELVLTLACGCTITLRDYGQNQSPTLVHAPACQDAHAKRHQGALFDGAIE